jgi:thymidine phosphorylase
MLVLAGIVPTVESGEQECRRRLGDGSAWERFLANVEAQGGEVSSVEDPSRGPRADTIVPLTADSDGYVQRVDAYKIGVAAGLLGASRARKEDSVRPEAGIELLKLQGDAVSAGEELCLLHLGRGGNLEEARRLVEQAYRFSRSPSQRSKRVMEELSSDDLGKS